MALCKEKITNLDGSLMWKSRLLRYYTNYNLTSELSYGPLLEKTQVCYLKQLENKNAWIISMELTVFLSFSL